MKNLQNVGRILFAIPLLIFGLFHLMSGPDMAGMVPSWLPGAVFLVYFAGLGLILAGVAILIKKQVLLATTLLAVMLLIFILTIHLPGVLDGDQMAMPSLLKDLAMIGGALVIGHFFDDKK
jgi:putative oxidoreductase